jgi:purine-nucleoside phosphorylase
MNNSEGYPLDLNRCSIESYLNRVKGTCRVIQQHSVIRPTVACVLGSGLGPLAENVQHPVSLDYSALPGFPQPRAAGHCGRLILGYLGGLPVVLMQGRCHRYEGHSQREIQFPIHVVRSLGAEFLITTNAAGGLNCRFEVGDLMLIDSHINFLWSRGQPLAPITQSAHGPSHAAGLSRSNPYSRWIIRRVQEIARKNGTLLHRGCYLGTLGPTYETRSEYRFFRWTGADAVGMSTIDEVLAARDLNMNVLGVSVITNVACPDAATATTHDEVIRAGDRAVPRLLSIIRQWLEELSGQPD